MARGHLAHAAVQAVLTAPRSVFSADSLETGHNRLQHKTDQKTVIKLKKNNKKQHNLKCLIFTFECMYKYFIFQLVCIKSQTKTLLALSKDISLEHVC